MIIANQLYKSFELNKKQQKELNIKDKTIDAVKNVSFTCQPGRVHALLGPNGAGKTTTLRMISTIFKPTSGEITVNGVNAVLNPQEAKKNIGFLTGSAGLYARLTPNEQITYFGQLYGVADSKIEERKKYLYNLLDMHDFKDKRIGKLSTGMKQKVSICRTMIHDPQVVIFDEPTSGLDVITAENIIQLIRDCKKQGKTVVFSSHIMSEVELLSDDITIINKGTVLYSDTMEAFRAQQQAPNITEEFIRIVQSQNSLSL